MGRDLVNGLGIPRLREMRELAMDVLGKAVRITGIDSPDKLVGDLSGGPKQAVAIARAVHFERRIVLLDEPTSTLSVCETETLLCLVLELKARGVSSVRVTHHIYHIYHTYQVCARFVIMSHRMKRRTRRAISSSPNGRLCCRRPGRFMPGRARDAVRSSGRWPASTRTSRTRAWSRWRPCGEPVRSFGVRAIVTGADVAHGVVARGPGLLIDAFAP